MNELFGVPMTAIMFVLLGVFAVCFMGFVSILLANRTMFRMGVRNVRRRRTQSILVITGLMLATVIITAAFSTGDAIDYSATNATYRNLQRTDLSLHHFRPLTGDVPFGQTYAPESVTAAFEERFSGDPDIEGFMPFLYEAVPVLDPRTRLAEPAVILAGFDPARLERFGGLELVEGGKADILRLADDEVLLGKRVAGKLDARVGDSVNVFARGQMTPLRVAGIVRDERASGELEFGAAVASGMAAKLATVQRITGHTGRITTLNVSLYGGVRGGLARTESAAGRLDTLQADDAAKRAMGLDGLAFQVEEVKKDAVDGSKLAASIFTTVFLVLGLFSIAAGAMLIFTLFVMLAAERRTEMGIARAVGAQRVHLLQSFVAEGAVYDLLAGLAGIVLGIGAAVLLVVGARWLVGSELSMMEPHIAPRSLIVSFCLGAVLTFVTVVISSVRVSQLNVVAAIRGQAGGGAQREAKRRNRWVWIVLGIPALLILPLGIYLLLRRGLGMPWAWIVGPGGIIVGAALTMTGGFSHLAFPYTLGVSLVILAVASVAQYYGLSRRLAWSLGGLGLAIFWLLPNDLGESIFGEFETTGMEMFVLSGIMVVTGFTLLIVFNARLLTTVFAAQRKGPKRYAAPLALAGGTGAMLLAGLFASDAGGGLGELGFLFAAFFAIFALLSLAAVRFTRFAPAFKMAVAYPLANRFRTGMTIAMFSIVVFSITVMGIINGSFIQMFTSDDGRGGWDVQIATSRSNPIVDLKASLTAAGFDTSPITAVGRLTQYDDNAQEVRQPGKDWIAYPIISADAAFYREARMKLEGRARGYATDRAVYDAVMSTPGLAVLDSAPLQAQGLGGGMMLQVKGVDISNGTFDPFQLEVRDPVTGNAKTVTIIGVLSAKIPANLFMGVYTNDATYKTVLGEPEYRNMFVRLTPGSDDVRTAKAIKAALVTQGVQAVSIEEQIDETVATSMAFLRIFQAFMALGLFVGIASLGVIALRSVVERRQQIGMLRAIGYQRGTVALSFILESGFIALMGILAGVVGATLLSWRLIQGGEFAGSGELGFFIPWNEIIVEVTFAFLFALLMTWWPSRRAAAVPIAEALRYE